jgi:hypothetical protein
MAQFGLGLVVVGLAVLVGGAVGQSALVGVLGSLVMFGGAALAVLNYKTATGAADPANGAAGARGAAAGGRAGKGARRSRQPLKTRLEERFRRRYDR